MTEPLDCLHCDRPLPEGPSTDHDFCGACFTALPKRLSIPLLFPASREDARTTALAWLQRCDP